MHALFRISLMASAMSIAVSGVAMAQAAYNGTYVGVSASINNGRCPTPQTPGPLTMTNGAVSSATGFFTGTVDAKGHVVMHTRESSRIEGNIDASGSFAAGGGPPSCQYTFVWKKR